MITFEQNIHTRTKISVNKSFSVPTSYPSSIQNYKLIHYFMVLLYLKSPRDSSQSL